MNQRRVRTKRTPLQSAPRRDVGAALAPTVNSPFSTRAFGFALALLVLNLIVFAPVRQYDFLMLDDPNYVTGNPQVAAGLTWGGVRWAFTTGHAANWHPLTWLSHMLDVQIYGMNAGPHHVTNVLLHIASTLLLFGLLHRMTGALGRSAFVSALFAVHPLHVESVAWVAERKDVLSTLFGMLTLWAYVRYVRWPRLGRYLVMALLFALGLMAKPMLVTLPFVLLLLDVWPLGRLSLGTDSTGGSGWAVSREPRSIGLQLAREKLPLLAISVASSIVTVVVQQRWGALGGLDALPLNVRLANALLSYAAYIGKMLWPARLAAFYPYPRSVSGWLVVGSLLGLLGMSGVVIRAARRHPYLAVGWLWYLGTLAPVIGLVQVGNQAMADRYTYIPLIGLFLMVGWGVPDLLARWPYRSIALPVAAGLVILTCTITARGQVHHWKNTLALWTRAAEATAENSLAHNKLGAALAEQGKNEEAIAHYSEALRLQPDRADAHNNLGVALAEQGKIDDAIHEFLEAIRFQPGQAAFHYNAGVLLEEKNNTAEALRHFETALQINPSHDSARRALEELRSRGTKPGP